MLARSCVSPLLLARHPAWWRKKYPKTPPPYQPDCEQPDKSEDANFCQQRRSADIAEQALRATNIQTWANVVGALISVSALILSAYAAKQAAVAANAASDTVQATREATQAQSRAWLSVKCSLMPAVAGRTHLGVDGIYINVIVEVCNRGASPATAVQFNAEIDLLGEGFEQVARMEEYSEAIRAKASSLNDAVFPACQTTLSHMVFLPIKRVNENLEKREFKAISPIVYGCISYRSPYVDGIRQTRFVYNLAAVINGAAVAIMPTHADWLTQPMFLLNPGTIAAD